MHFSTGTLWNLFVVRHVIEIISPVSTGESKTQKTPIYSHEEKMAKRPSLMMSLFAWFHVVTNRLNVTYFDKAKSLFMTWDL